jgi:hypothetical protein
MTKLEEVRGAIWTSIHDSLTDEQRAAIDFHNMTFDAAARAAVEALREPTVPMLDAGHQGLVHGPRYEVIDCYQAMIDAILSEAESP